jgi:adenosylhomocysteine nucleosidase
LQGVGLTAGQFWQFASSASISSFRTYDSAMPGSTFFLTALTTEANALRTVGIAATVIGIRGSRLGAVVVSPGTTRIIMAGVGGGLDPALAVSDVIVDGPEDFAVPGARRGTIHTADRIVSTVAEKAALFAATGAAVVDMEQAVVRKWAEQHGLPVIGIRAVSDTAADAIDPAVLGFVNDIGSVRPFRLAAAIVGRPGLVPQLRRLGRDTKTALQALQKIILGLEM